jgi:signal transduction histidine kinase
VYRAVQEALTNCVRHAKARSIDVRVTNDGDYFDVSVTDDGIGFDSAQRVSGLGLRGIAERVKELHGVMAIGNAEGGGTKLAISLPVPVSAISLPAPVSASEVPLARAVS